MTTTLNPVPGNTADPDCPGRVRLSCTVVVCTRDRPLELEECLVAIRRQDYADCSVLVVDSAPRIPAISVCQRHQVAYLLEPLPGLSRARNHGAAAASTELVAFTDDDAVPEPGWLSALAAEFADPEVMAVAGRIRNLQGTALGRMAGEEPERARWDARPHRIFDRSTPNWFSLASFGGIGDGGNLAFRRRAFDVWPGFDERIGRGCPIDGGEEHIAFATLIDRGCRVVYTPHAVVKHPCPADPREIRAKEIAALRSLFAYVCYLWTQFPAHRPALARRLGRSIMGRRSAPWRLGRPNQILFRPWAWKPILSGLYLYLTIKMSKQATP